MDIELDKDHQHMTLPKPEYYIIFTSIIYLCLQIFI
jgi:hypothetical protein